MINTAKASVGVVISWKFLELSSPHLWKRFDDRRHVRDFIDADYFGGEVFLLHF